MATYLYCLRSDPAAPPNDLLGIDGARVRAIESAGLTAWVSDVEDQSEGALSASMERVKAHDAVCAAALSSGETPLPVRFGQTFADEAATSSAIAARQAALRSRLTRISGCVELRIVVTRGRDADVNVTADAGDESESDAVAAGSDASPAEEGPGTAFLRRLARQGRADLAREVGCEEIRHTVRKAVTSLIVDQHPCESARGVAFFPVLVRRLAVDEFRAAVADLLSAQPIALSVLGPFAPYSFAGDA